LDSWKKKKFLSLQLCSFNFLQGFPLLASKRSNQLAKICAKCILQYFSSSMIEQFRMIGAERHG
jgi:hypothetical protein